MTDHCNDRRPHIILVEVDADQRRTLQLMLQGSGFDVRAFSCGRDALSNPAMKETCCLITNDWIADMNGKDLLHRFRAQGWLHPAILLTAATAACSCELDDFSIVLKKPLRGQMLIDALKRTIRP